MMTATEMRKRNKHVGSSLDQFLKKEGILEEARAIVAKEALAWRAAGRQRFEAAYTPRGSVYEHLIDDAPSR